MHKRLTSFLNDQKILYKIKFGFQNNSSIAHAIISLIDSIEKAMDNNVFACGIFTDLQKSFDTVDHKKFFYKLYHYGIKDLVNS